MIEDRLLKNTFHQLVVDEEKLNKVGLSFKDFENRPQNQEISDVWITNVQDPKIKEKILKLYKKDQEQQFKQRLKAAREWKKLLKQAGGNPYSI